MVCFGCFPAGDGCRVSSCIFSGEALASTPTPIGLCPCPRLRGQGQAHGVIGCEGQLLKGEIGAGWRPGWLGFGGNGEGVGGARPAGACHRWGFFRLGAALAAPNRKNPSLFRRRRAPKALAAAQAVPETLFVGRAVLTNGRGALFT